jgi:outer membrane protein
MAYPDAAPIFSWTERRPSCRDGAARKHRRKLGDIMAYRRNPLFRRQIIAGACWLLALPLMAQEKQPPRLPPREGNAFTRVFKGNYETPTVRPVPLRGELELESMVRDEKIEITDEDAVRLALANNVDINVLRYSPYFSLWGIEGGRAVLNPSVQFNTNINRLVTPASNALQGGTTAFNLTNLYGVNVHKPFVRGLDFDFNYNTTRVRTNSIFNSINPSLTSGWSIGITQHLLKDYGKISRGRYLTIAQNNFSQSLESFTASATNIITNVLNTYWALVFSDEDIGVKESSLKLAQTVLEQTKIQEQVGTMAQLDVLQAESEVAARNQQVIAARNARRLAEDQLKKLLSSKQDPGLLAATIIPISRPQPPPQPKIAASEAIQRALEVRPEIRQQLINQQNNKIQVDYTRNQLRPVLDFVAGYSQNGLGGNLIQRDYSQGIFNAPIIGVVPGGFIDSLNSLFSRKYIGYTLGLSLKVPIGNDQARTSNAQAQITYRQGEESLRALRQQIALEVRQAYNAMELTRANVEAAEVTVRFQQQRLQGEQDKYMLGASTTRFVIEAQRDLLNAQTVLLQAKIGWILSRIALDKAVGETFATHNIVLEDALNLSFK